MNLTFILLLNLFVVTMLGCTDVSQDTSSDGASDFYGSYKKQKTLPQGWDWDQQQKFWFLPQGSQIIPYQWFLSLKQKDQDKNFRDSANMDGYRYLPQMKVPETAAYNPDGLPIGFTRGEGKLNSYREVSEFWLGLNCAACHTGQVEYMKNGTTYRYLIDGAPAMADFEGMMLGLVDAMQDTLDKPKKLDAFFNDVKGKDGGTTDSDVLSEQLEKRTKALRAWIKRNSGTSPYGFARLDAIGAIFNEIEVAALADPDSVRTADAPVSYPFIWNTPQYDFVQWNGSVYNRGNSGVGAMGRNVGEVLGVFGALELNTTTVSENGTPGFRPIGSGHETSVNFGNLSELEELLWKLRSPTWPQSTFGAINLGLAAKGKKLFEGKTENGQQVVKGEELGCSGCHRPIDQESNREFKSTLVPIRGIKKDGSVAEIKGHGTDPAMAVNFITRRTETGELEGVPKKYDPRNTAAGKFEEAAASAELLGFAVAGTLAGPKNADPAVFGALIHAGRPNPEYMGQPDPMPDRGEMDPCTWQTNHPYGKPEPDPPYIRGFCYKARSHNGIWATGPYLHNGSVRTIRQLLLPKTRQDTFYVGTRKYDPVNIGFADGKASAGDSEFDTTLPGNSNDGHHYGSEFFENNENGVKAVLEYLKTL